MKTPRKIPLDQINATDLPRDRTLIGQDAQTELQSSIAQNGLRIPIELYQTKTGLALISGYRRLLAFRSLHALTDPRRAPHNTNKNPLYPPTNFTLTLRCTVAKRPKQFVLAQMRGLARNCETIFREATRPKGRAQPVLVTRAGIEVYNYNANYKNRSP